MWKWGPQISFKLTHMKVGHNWGWLWKFQLKRTSAFRERPFWKYQVGVLKIGWFLIFNFGPIFKFLSFLSYLSISIALPDKASVLVDKTLGSRKIFRKKSKWLIFPLKIRILDRIFQNFAFLETSKTAKFIRYYHFFEYMGRLSPKVAIKSILGKFSHQGP